MKRRRPRYSSGLTKKQLLGCLALFLIAMSLPVYLLVAKVYAQLDREMFFNASRSAGELARRIDQALQTSLQKEQDRPIAEYRFFNVLENPLFNASGLKFSPLSELPPKTGIAGLVGYFQIDADGSFHIPALPEIEKGALSQLSPEELSKRLQLKETLRSLLSSDRLDPNKPRAASPALNDETGQTTKENRQAYLLDKLQETAAEADAKQESNADGIRDKQLRQWRIDSGQWDKELGKNSYPEKKKSASLLNKLRKETVKLPEQSWSGALLERPRAPAETAPKRQAEAEAEQDAGAPLPASAQAPQADALASRKPVIFSFESEVGPLQMLALPSAHLCFYRQVWHQKNRFIQGFVVEPRNFWQTAVQPLLNGSAYSSLLLVDNSGIGQRFGQPGGQAETLLYRGALSPPLQSVELIVNTAGLEPGPGKSIVDLLTLSLVCIIAGGVAVLYRLGAKQIDMTRQQQNFISAVSHELKTPLTSIRMYGEMLRSGWVSEEARKQTYYDYIFFESERLSRLITNVLHWARLENGHANPQLCQVAAKVLLQRVQEKNDAQIKAAGFAANSRIEPGLEEVTVNVDEDSFSQIVINLIDNALKFASAASNKTLDIGFKTGNRQNEIVFFIRDYGPGIKKNEIRKIFKLFYRAGEELTRTTPGTGIGLALAKQLAGSMNARLTVETRQPGAEFQIILKRG